MKIRYVLYILVTICTILFINSSKSEAEETSIIEGVYSIASAKNTNYVLDITAASNMDSANVEIWSYHGGNNQKYDITSAGDGFYKIKAMNSGKYISVETSSTEAGANINQQTYTGESNQLWKIIKTEDGYYKFISKNNELCIDIFGSNMKDGTNVIVWTEHDGLNQRFKLNPCFDNSEATKPTDSSDNKEEDKIETTETNNDNNEENISNTELNDNSENNNNEDSTDVVDIHFAEGVYSIVSAKNTNYVMDITASSNMDSANVEIWTNHRGKNQRFDITSVGDGYYKIKAMNSGKYISIETEATEPGANIIQQTYNGNSNQLWKIEKTEDGYFKFVSKYNGLCIDIFGGMMNDGTNVIMWTEHDGLNQKFRLDPCYDNNISSGTYEIVSTIDNKYVLDVEARSNNDGANIELWSKHGGNNQKFYFKDSGKGYYTIYSVNSKKYLDVENGSKSNGANIIQYRKTGKDSQQWFLRPASNGNYYIINSSGLYMGIKGSEANDGTNIATFVYNQNNNQEFKLVPTAPNIEATGRSAEFKRNHPDIQVGIDVSYFQGTIDWNAVKNDGVDYAILRAGFRGYGESGSLNEDSTFARNAIGARNAGLDVGVYFFSQAKNYDEGVREALYTLDLIKKYDITYPIAFDTEASSSPNNTGRADNISVQARTDAARGFCETIEKAGYKSLIYASPSWLQTKLDLSQLSQYNVWLANYTGATQDDPLKRPSSYKGDYVMWQYTSTGSINGINGNVDCNIYYYLKDN